MSYWEVYILINLVFWLSLVIGIGFTIGKKLTERIMDVLSEMSRNKIKNRREKYNHFRSSRKWMTKK